ncbi:ATP-grasp domain-containing protein [Mesorhizobium australafricanum]|uniref:Acetyl-CoA carboxylase biotin carboxylase subunit family protein n=1 Tax=Mesorhizobium australafricanum TaxID=3072311 RepID=A0ABU4X5N3_9HYPH|nr:acetyl-CoA carboxylase biotin carboxylase subunit family protein [Mesorhizobium sp. VK3E]MDX8443639.1 acetyl-CoA carboxylase biotin carboxylase subunit family protein [Mesorhizobium sp. VK3E]
MVKRRALILLEGNPRGNGLLYAKVAQRLGLHPITLASDPAQFGYLAAEGLEAIRIDTGDTELLMRECARLRGTYEIAGITSVLEAAYGKVAELCRHFDLPGPNPLAIERCCDKCVQRHLLAQAGIPMPAYRIAEEAADIQFAVAELGFPVIAKPAVGSGSRGVRLCRNAKELAEHTTHLLGGKHEWQSGPTILIEEFAQGPYYCAYTMGDVFIGVAAAEFDPPPHFVYRETTFPALLSEADQGRIADISLNCLRVLGLLWGPANIELRWTKRGPVVIEVNPRMAGAPDPQLIELAYGIDLIGEHIKLIVGDKWEINRSQSLDAASRNLVADRDGILDWIQGVSEAAAVPGVTEVKLHMDSKTPIIRKGDARDLLGRVVAAAPSRARTEAILQRAVNLIRWSISSSSVDGE